MDPRITWSTPATIHHTRYATWEGRVVFASVSPSHRMGVPKWMLMLYPSGQTSHAHVSYVASEAQAKRFAERWANAHPDAIGRPPPPPKRTF